MDIAFSSKKFEDTCNSEDARKKAYGKREGALLGQRLDDMRAARSLEDMRHLPGRCHELKGDRRGQLGLDLVHPHRLIIVPANDPVPRKEDNGLDWAKVTAIKVIEIAKDYH